MEHNIALFLGSLTAHQDDVLEAIRSYVARHGLAWRMRLMPFDSKPHPSFPAKIDGLIGC